MSKLLFIGAPDRSGTTLLQRLLDCHPEIDALPQLYFVKDLVNFSDSLNRYINNGLIEKTILTNDFRQAAQVLITSQALKKNAKIISEKTPQNVLYFHGIKNLFPDAKFIFLQRDPYDVLKSMRAVRERMKKNDIHPDGYLRNQLTTIFYLVKCLEAGLSFSKIFPSHCLVVEYEKLLHNPQVEMDRIFRFLQLPEHKVLLTSDDNVKSKVKLDGIWYDEATYYRNIEKKESRSTTFTHQELLLNIVLRKKIRQDTKTKNKTNIKAVAQMRSILAYYIFYVPLASFIEIKDRLRK